MRIIAWAPSLVVVPIGILLGIATASAPVAVSAQTAAIDGSADGARFHITPFGGLLGFSTLGEVEGELTDASAAGAPYLINNVEMRAEAMPVIGLAIGWSATRSLDLRLSGVWGKTEFDLAGLVARPETSSFAGLETVGGLGDVFVSAVDLDVLWRLADRGSPVSPYAVMGVGGTIWDLNAMTDFEHIQPVTGVGFDISPRTKVSPALAFGIGADIRLGGGAGLRLEVADRIATNPVSDWDFQQGPDFSGGADAAELVHHFDVRMGLLLDLGGQADHPDVAAAP